MIDKETRLKRKSLKISTIEGAVASVMIGFGNAFVGAFAVFLQSTSVQLGLLSGIPQIVGSTAQMGSNWLMEKISSRQRIVVALSYLQSLTWLPMTLLFWLGSFGPWALIAITTLYSIAGALAGPAWNSWMGDLVPAKERGGYFGLRNRVANSAYLLSTLAAGGTLALFKGYGWEYLGFVAIFIVAFVARALSASMLTRKYDPPFHLDPKMQFSFWQFIKVAWWRNFGKFALYIASMSFAVNLSGPFFAAYMLKDLHMGYITFTLITSTTVLAKIIAMPVWGRLCDRYGSRRILTLSGPALAVIPVLWLVSTDPAWIFIVHAIAGTVWAGYEISHYTFIFDCTSPERRTTCISYLTLMSGTAAFLGGLTGGWIAEHNTLFWSPFVLLFLLSGLGRALAALVFMPRIKEMRQVDSTSYRNIVHTVVTAPLHEVSHFAHLNWGKYLAHNTLLKKSRSIMRTILPRKMFFKRRRKR